MNQQPRNGRRRVLVVDDDNVTRTLTLRLLEALGHDVEAAHNGAEGLEKLKAGVDLVLLDVVMPGMDGFELCERIRRDPGGEDVPVIMVTAKASREDRLRAVEVGANDFIAKPVDEAELRIRSASLLKMKDATDAMKMYRDHLEELVEERSASLRLTLYDACDAQHKMYLAQLDTVHRLAIVAEYKDRVTARHIERMSEYCATVARGLSLPTEEVELILHASRMHDVGKIAIPDAILQKSGSLTDEEWAVMRQHPETGAAILGNSTSQVLEAGRVIALNHHEWWDGRGYPHGLSGENIPLWGRICAVADVYDAITSERPYKPAFSNDEGLRVLHEGRGTHFDPRLIDVFVERLDEILHVQQRLRDPISAPTATRVHTRGTSAT
jgi:putative two-component system response regulator